MCDELQTAIEMQEQLGSDTTKGALMLLKAAVKSMKKMNDKFDKHIVEADAHMKQIDNKIDHLTAIVEQSQADAAKYKLVVEICKALFGTPQKCLMTLVYICVLFGMAHMPDLIELLKALV